MKVTTNFDKRILNIEGLVGNISAQITKSLQESADIVKKNIRVEMRNPDKQGEFNINKRRYRGTGMRRSASGQSLAIDTGKSLELVSSNRIANNKIEVGFKVNPDGYNYVKYWENKDRPTVENAVRASIPTIESIFQKNLKPKG